ncbi:MAG: rRNA maturation RNase YbeY [Deltaproteobacteria bacterium]|nr:rRNA maturation RNase YbeY [Deltaproteobacteria bacterium]
MDVWIQNNQKLQRIPKKRIEVFMNALSKHLDLEKKAPCEISISFVTDLEMKKINTKYRRIAKTTDILSFPMDDVCLGDLVISVQRTRLQAEERNHSFGIELKHLLVHGLLHLLGYEHKENPDPMRVLEKALLQKTKGFSL